jgi:hypothetical protein
VVNKSDREIVQHIDAEFASLIKSLKDLAPSVPPENLLRSAAVIEQMCGGLTANLWDDPFEWTLPETLSNVDRVIEYLGEVDVARQRAFDSIDDAALSKFIALPSGESQVLISLLLETLIKSQKHLDRIQDVQDLHDEA